MTEETEQELHPVVRLLIARMKSNPDEFFGGRTENYQTANTWANVINSIAPHTNEAEQVALGAATREAAGAPVNS